MSTYLGRTEGAPQLHPRPERERGEIVVMATDRETPAHVPSVEPEHVTGSFANGLTKSAPPKHLSQPLLNGQLPIVLT
jgi:hypothetical protein